MRLATVFHFGRKFPPSEVSAVLSPLPSGFTVYNCDTPASRFEENTILLFTPHEGSLSSAGVNVIFTGTSVPFEAITNMSYWLPSRFDTNANLLPSGDHVGLMSSAGWLVSRVCVEPS